MDRIGPAHDPCKKGQSMASETHTHTLSSSNQILLWAAVAVIVLGVVYFTI
jgi:hypothetical protein